MIKAIQVSVLFLFLNSLALGQSSVWKVEGNGNTLYIAGTVHVLKASDYPLPKEFDAAYNSASVVVFETDMKKLSDPSVSQSLVMQSMYTDGRTLKTVLSEKAYNALAKESLEVGVPMAQLERFKPSMAVMMVTMLKLKKMGVASEGVDSYYLSKMTEDEKGMKFLEPVEEQIQLLSTMGDGYENDFVLHSIKDFDRMETEFEELIRTWRDGSSLVMIDQLKDMKKDYPVLYQDMVVERNNKWLPTISSFLTDTEVEFVLVGALHLHGQDGILTQLVAQGFTVTQL